jgi:hypothetical protein
MVVAIQPGATHEWQWQGLDHVLEDRMMLGQTTLQCEAAQPVAPGLLQARVTYSLSKVDQPPESRIGTPIVLTEAFQHPPAATVLFVAR